LVLIQNYYLDFFNSNRYQVYVPIAIGIKISLEICCRDAMHCVSTKHGMKILGEKLKIEFMKRIFNVLIFKQGFVRNRICLKILSLGH